MAEEKFAAFFSYVHQDDDHDDGRISKIRKWLENEISAQTGEDFQIFQDRSDISWGDAWEERINGALDGSTFLIAIITPRYLKSVYCRKEFQRFTKREKELSRNDLILPLLYMDTQSLADTDDEVAVEISSRQYADWRSLRFEPWTNPDVRRRLSELSSMVVNSIPQKTTQPKPQKTRKTENESNLVKEVLESTSRKPSTSIEPLTLIVDPMPRRGDFTTITDAIQSAEPGTRILIRPGLYKEAIVLDKALELIGDGERDDIVIETTNSDVVFFKTGFGRVSNLTLRQVGEGKFYAVDISQGRLELEDCDISSESLASVAIHDGADPRLRRNRIHDSSNNSAGILIYQNGKGTLEDNDIWGNRNAGIRIRSGGNPTLRRNNITKNRYEAIWISDNSGGIFEHNDLRNNEHGAWDIDSSSQDNVTKRNNIED